MFGQLGTQTHIWWWVGGVGLWVGRVWMGVGGESVGGGEGESERDV